MLLPLPRLLDGPVPAAKPNFCVTLLSSEMEKEMEEEGVEPHVPCAGELHLSEKLCGLQTAQHMDFPPLCLWYLEGVVEEVVGGRLVGVEEGVKPLPLKTDQEGVEVEVEVLL